MSELRLDVGHSTSWAPAKSSSGYPTAESSGEMPMMHAVTYSPGDSPSKLVVRRTFIECVNEETEGLRTAAARHRSDPAVPTFAGFETHFLPNESLAEETASTNSSNDGKGHQRAEGRRDKTSSCNEKSDSEDSDEIFNGGFFDGEEQSHREVSEVGEPDTKLVVKHTFLEVVEPLEADREHRSMSMPVGGQVSEDPNAPSLTEQLLARMRTMQGWPERMKPGEGSLPMTRLSGSTHKAQGAPPRETDLKIDSGFPSASVQQLRCPPGIPEPMQQVRFASESVEHSQPNPNRRCSEYSITASSTAESETALESECAPDDVEPDPSLGPRTTVMLRNLPSNYTRPLLLDLLDREGFFASYDFVYLPIDFGSRSGFGYAFINLCGVETAERFRAHFQGFTGWETACSKVADVTWSGTHQGFEQHVNRYRNSPVMHETMPDECKPIVLKDGIRIDFPAPTKILRPPRIRPSKNRGAKLAAERRS